MKPDFPSIGDEIAEPRPDKNIKVAAFSVSETSINIYIFENVTKQTVLVYVININVNGMLNYSAH